ncbi:glycosyltransferase family 2 protein [Streptosporangium sp. NPDC000239]|uniref:glycosyltransferase n=1 Tax=Streptosporangium sp. NPDC000239 TaxID=3154248 RepID=UPI00332F0B0C
MSEARERREAGSGTAGPSLDGEDGALRTGGEDGTGQVAVPPARNTGGVARVRHNDYGSLTPPEPGHWEPRLGVSVVIAAYDCQESLDRTLASLAAQTYPAHLTEVVVADDGSEPPLRIDGPAPAGTRIVRVPEGRWGRGWARQTGAASATGDVLLWVDADVVLDREHVEAHMRWHHLAPYAVVLGDIRFTPEPSGDAPGPEEVLAAVRRGRAEDLFPVSAPHAWRAERFAETRRLREAGSRAHLLHSGAATSVPLALLRAAGGVNTALNMGEDTDLGFRLAQAGAVFVPDPRATAWHLGPSTVMTREKEVHRHNWSVLPDLIPDLRWLRAHPRRTWLVPYVRVVVDAAGATYEEVRTSVDAALAGTLADVAVTVTGPWSALPRGRRSSLDEPLLDLRLVRNLYGGEPRVSFAETVPDAAPAPFLLTCPAGWALGPDTLARLVEHAESEGYGLLSVVLDERENGVTAARLERTSAFARAALVAGDDRDDLVHEMFGSLWVGGEEFGFTPADRSQPVAGDTARWRAEAARWRREAERLEDEVRSLRREAQEARERAEQAGAERRRGPIGEIIATVRHRRAG